MHHNDLTTIEKPLTLSIISTGVLYRNPIPHVRSSHAYFPSVVSMDNGEKLATFALGEAFEAANLATNVVRSVDGGESWQMEAPMNLDVADRITSNCSRLTSIGNGELVAFTVRADRSQHIDEGLANPLNIGFVPTELLLTRSYDYGHNWTKPETLQPPLEGPEFELCSPITILRDGRWVLPTSTWRGWDGYCPNGMKMVALVSHDQGHSWPDYWDVMNDAEQHIIYWESKILELHDGRLLAVAWAYDEERAKDLDNHYAISEDGGRTWSEPKSTELHGQTIASLILSDDRILSIYRRVDKPGLWANIASLEGGEWLSESHFPIWGSPELKVGGQEGNNMAQEFQNLKFGAPSLLMETNGDVTVYFWCYEAGVSNIRWIKLQIS